MSGKKPNFTRRQILRGGLASTLLRKTMAGLPAVSLASRIAVAQEKAPPLPPLPLKTGAKVAFLGDSIIRRGHANASPREMSSLARGEHFWAKVYDQRFRIETWFDPEDPYGRGGAKIEKGPGFNGANQGIDGEHAVAEFTVPGTLARVPYTLSKNPDIVLLHVGTNDINSGTDEKTLIDRLEQNLAAIRAGGKWAIISTIYPRATTGQYAWPAGHIKWKRRRAVNDYIKGLAGRDGIMVFDPNPLLANPGSSGDEQELRPGFSTDGGHPNARGAEPAGKALAALLAKMISPGSVIETDPTKSNLLQYARMAGASAPSGTQITGTLAANWFSFMSGQSAVACSKEAGENGIEKQVLAFTPANDGGAARQDTFTLAHADIVPASVGLNANEWVQFGGFLEVSPWDGWVAHFCQFAQRQGRDVLWGAAAGKPAGRDLEQMPVEGFSGWWYSDPVQIVADVDRVRLTFSVEIAKSATGSGTIKISRPFLRKVADPRLDWKA